MNAPRIILALVCLVTAGASMFGGCANQIPDKTWDEVQETATVDQKAAATLQQDKGLGCRDTLHTLWDEGCKSLFGNLRYWHELFESCVEDSWGNCLIKAQSCQEAQFCMLYERFRLPGKRNKTTQAIRDRKKIQIPPEARFHLKRGMGRALKEAVRAAREEVRKVRIAQATQVMRERTGSTGWSEACSNIDRLYLASCTGYETSFKRETCLKQIKDHLREKPLYLIKDVYRIIQYKPDQKMFAVTVPGILDGEFNQEDCWREPCITHGVTSRPFRMAKGEVKQAQWKTRYTQAIREVSKPVKTIKVLTKDLKQPEEFENKLVIDALVRITDRQALSIEGEDWFYVDNLQVQVVGLRAYTTDLEWSAPLIKTSPRMRIGCKPF